MHCFFLLFLLLKNIVSVILILEILNELQKNIKSRKLSLTKINITHHFKMYNSYYYYKV